MTGLNLNTVKSACRRSGLFEDNPEHAALFVIPAASHSTIIGTIKPLPPQRVITGHKQTDAYLWVIEVIKTGEPSHIAAAEAALQKLTIKPKEAQDRYTDYLMVQGRVLPQRLRLSAWITPRDISTGRKNNTRRRQRSGLFLAATRRLWR
ncbi:hypothetical protein [Serratia marcescens]|uniref:hypothetical protein n=1 Tax=Serratia marcescens TaxID=615 RepID=UPI003989D754